MALTKKQETFCIEVVKQPTYSAAYRIAYDAQNMTDKSINEKASELMSNVKIKSRVQELKEKIENKELYTLKQSIKRDLKLIERYEAALDVLEDINAPLKELQAAERTIRFIGSHGYNSAQERVSKQHGWFKQDNKQKIPKRVIVDKSNYNKE